MGRLLKKEVDEIAHLRKQGYAQKEVAQKLGVHVRTVRKYDPTHKAAEHRDMNNDAVESIKSVLPVILDWLEIQTYSLLKELICDNKHKHICPRCHNESFEYGIEEAAFICRECGYRPVMPYDICRSCFANRILEFDKDSRTWLCQECRAMQR